MTEPKFISLQEFVDLGFVHEINRLVLHPAGLAMSYSVDDDGKVLGFAEIWDDRDDPEGIVFGKLDFDKIASVKDLHGAHIKGRVELLSPWHRFGNAGQAVIQTKDLT